MTVVIESLLQSSRQSLHQLADLERLPGHLAHAFGRNQIFGSKHRDELTGVHLRYDHLIESTEQIAQVAGERLEIPDMDVGHRVTLASELPNRLVNRPERGSPPYDRHLAVILA